MTNDTVYSAKQGLVLDRYQFTATRLYGSSMTENSRLYAADQPRYRSSI